METMPCDMLPEAAEMGVRKNIELSAILLATDLFIIRLRCCRRPLLVVLVANGIYFIYFLLLKQNKKRWWAKFSSLLSTPLPFYFYLSFYFCVFQCHGLNWTGRLISLNDLGRSGSGSTSHITRRRSHEVVGVVADLSPPRSRIGFVIF